MSTNDKHENSDGNGVSVLAWGATSLAAQPAENSIFAPGAQLEKLADGFTFTEGPAWDAQGNVYFTDQPNDAHSEVERGRQTLHVYEAVRALQRPVLRQAWQPVGLRR